jgi:hypothetical protein
MLFGGRAAFSPESADTVRESAQLLRQGMVSVYPQLRDAKVEFVCMGTKLAGVICGAGRESVSEDCISPRAD